MYLYICAHIIHTHTHTCVYNNHRKRGHQLESGGEAWKQFNSGELGGAGGKEAKRWENVMM